MDNDIYCGYTTELGGLSSVSETGTDRERNKGRKWNEKELRLRLIIVKRKKSEKGAEEEEKFGNGVKSVQKLDVQ